MTLSRKEIQSKRAEAQQLTVTVHVGKAGIDAAVPELKAQLKKRKLVKVRLLPSATEGGKDDAGQAEALAAACNATIIDVRGHTAVYWRA